MVVECRICLKTMTIDTLKRHLKTYEMMNSIAETHRREKSSDKCTNINLDMLEKNVEYYVDEFNRKIELGRNLKIIINKRGFNIHALPEYMKEALETYGLYGENMDREIC